MKDIRGFNPTTINKKSFVRYYIHPGVDMNNLIRCLCVVENAKIKLNALELMPLDKKIRGEAYSLLAQISEWHLGKKGENSVAEIKKYIYETKGRENLNLIMKEAYDDFLEDLSTGYRKIIKRRHKEL